MNAILVFDPSNDLLFVKSNQLYRARLLKYAQTQGLLSPERKGDKAPPSGRRRRRGRHRSCHCCKRRHDAVSRRRRPKDNEHESSDLNDSSSSSSCSCSSSSSHSHSHSNGPNQPANDAIHHPHWPASSSSAHEAKGTTKTEISNDAAKDRQQQRQQTDSHSCPRSSGSSAARQFGQNDQENLARNRKPRRRTTTKTTSSPLDDTSKRYLDILMLLLTPYVASLRLSNNLQLQQRRSAAYDAQPPQASGSPSAPCPSGGVAASNPSGSNLAKEQQKAARVASSSLLGAWWPAGGSSGHSDGKSASLRSLGPSSILSGGPSGQDVASSTSLLTKRSANVLNATPEKSGPSGGGRRRASGNQRALAWNQSADRATGVSRVSHSAAAAEVKQNQREEEEEEEKEEEDLLAKFMNSININHECKMNVDHLPPASDAQNAPKHQLAHGASQKLYKSSPSPLGHSSCQTRPNSSDNPPEACDPIRRHSSQRQQPPVCSSALRAHRVALPARPSDQSNPKATQHSLKSPPSKQTPLPGRSNEQEHNDEPTESSSARGALYEHLRGHLDESHLPSQLERAGLGPSKPRISTAKMPVECLQDCQVVYCELYDFIFIYMQELESVSSFKMRLLQRRCDMFARLTLLLFGQCLGSLRRGPSWPRAKPPTEEPQGVLQVAADPTQLLRRLFDSWFEHQFEPELFLEAHEMLIVGSHIASICQSALKAISARLRAHESEPPAAQAANLRQEIELKTLESHQHALLFSGLKLISQFSCLNSAASLEADNGADLALLLILLKTFNRDHQNDLETSSSADEEEEEGARARAGAAENQPGQQPFHSRPMYKSHYWQDKQTYQIHGDASARSTTARTPATSEQSVRLPSQFPVFLRGRSRGASSNQAGLAGLQEDERPLVPHMVRFVALQRGITLILVSEISQISYLSLHLGRVHRLLLEFGRASAMAAAAAAAAGPLEEYEGHRDHDDADDDDDHLGDQDQDDSRQLTSVQRVKARAREPTLHHHGDKARNCAGALLKLSQLSRVNDCISAIKNYFHRLDLAEMLEEQWRRQRRQQQPQQCRNRGAGGSRPNPEFQPEGDLELELDDAHELEEKFRASGASSSTTTSRFSELLSKLLKTQQPAGHLDSDKFHGRPDCGVQGRGRPPVRAGHDEQETQRPVVRRRRVMETLAPAEARLCRHLLRKLDELAQSNMITYMRQTFGMSLDDHKREALLGSVCSVVRDSLSAFVLEPQLTRLAAHHYLRHFGARMDSARLMAREQLSDYLNYLAVKSTCNVTLGAPLTHDMQSISAFIYLDRSRQQLVQSPTRRTVAMTVHELAEADFRSAIERHQRLEAKRRMREERHWGGPESALSSSSSSSSSSDGPERSSNNLNDDDDELTMAQRRFGREYKAAGEQADHSDQASSSRSSESDCESGWRMRGNQSSKRLDGPRPRQQGLQREASKSVETIKVVAPSSESLMMRHSNRQATRTARGIDRFLLGTSQDVLLGQHSNTSSSSVATSSHQSILMAPSSVTATSALSSNMELDLDLTGTEELQRLQGFKEMQQQQQQQQSKHSRHSCDENLLKGFSAFIYNRLAQGQVGSFSQTDGTYNLTYFLWFKRNSSSSNINDNNARNSVRSHDFEQDEREKPA